MIWASELTGPSLPVLEVRHKPRDLQNLSLKVKFVLEAADRPRSTSLPPERYHGRLPLEFGLSTGNQLPAWLFAEAERLSENVCSSLLFQYRADTSTRS